ncbi:MAG: hypothetical protein WDW36_001100 [Sanguina aurantia]
MTRQSGWKTIANASYTFLCSASAVWVLTKYGVFISKVEGPSMFPTFSGRGDIIIAEAITPTWGTIVVGDVVICTRPVNPRECIIKRVVATEGNEVTVFPDKTHANVRRHRVPAGHVWVQGDNMTHSLDSRQYGPIPLALVRGRVLLQVYPFVKCIDCSPPRLT